MPRITALAALKLFVRVALLRLRNRSAAFVALGKRGQSAEARSGTQHRDIARKSWTRRLTWMLPAAMLLGWAMFVSIFVFSLVDAARLREMRSSRQIAVTQAEYDELQQASSFDDGAAREKALESTVSSLFGSAVSWLDSDMKKVVGDRLAADGVEALSVVTDTGPWRGSAAVLSSGTRNEVFAAIGLYLFLTYFSFTLSGIALMDKNLTQADPSLAWLMQFPISRSVLLTAKLAGYAAESGGAVIAVIIGCVTSWMCGFSFGGALATALLAGVVVSLTTAAIRLAAEVLLFRFFNRKARGAIVGAASILGGLGVIYAMFGYNARPSLELFPTIARSLPTWFYWNPLSQGIGTAWQTVGTSTAWVLIAPLVAVAFSIGVVVVCTRLIAFGVGGGQDSVRGATAIVGSRTARRQWSGMIGKELLQIRRRPEQLAQILFTPLFIGLLLYLSGKGEAMTYATQNVASICVAAFIGASYLLMVAVTQTLSSELKTLWFLQSMPRSLATCIRAKSRVWAAVAMFMLVAVLGGYAMWQPAEAGRIAVRIPFMAAALWLLSEAMFGFVSLSATVVNDQTVQFRRSAMLIPALLSGNCATVIYGGNLWDEAVLLVVLAMTNLAVRQKQDVELPWLSEPSDSPPQRLYALHGLLTIAAFLFVRDLTKGVLLAMGFEAAEVLAYAFTLGAVIVGVGTWWWMQRRGFRVSLERPQAMPWKLVGAAVALTCLVGFAWQQVLSVLLPDGGRGGVGLSWQPAADGGYRGAIALLAMVVVIAPIFEEWLFRGVLFRSLRSSAGMWTSIVATSLLFAVIHPPASFVPVFVLGLATAWVAEKSGRLWPSMLVHIGYNLFVVTMWNMQA